MCAPKTSFETSQSVSPVLVLVVVPVLALVLAPELAPVLAPEPVPAPVPELVVESARCRPER